MGTRLALSLLTAGTLLAPVAHAQVVMTFLGEVDVGSTAAAGNPEYIGSNPVALAWDGTNVWLAGYYSNAPGSPNANVGIVKLNNALTQSPTFDPVFGSLSTPPERGYSGLAILPTPTGQKLLSAAYDNGGANPAGLQLFDGDTRAQLWSKNIRGGSGVAFDPGFPGGNPALGEGVAWTTFGSGRRMLQDTTSGADIWDTTNGMIWLPAGMFSNNFARDVDFDPATGDIWVRSRNEVIRARRTGDNDTRDSNLMQNGEIVVDLADGPFVNQQNIEFIRTRSGSIVIFNDRSVAGSSQVMIEDPNSGNQFYVVKAARPDGTTQPIAWDPTFVPALGNGSYDFSYDALTNSLAILDAANRKVYFFSVDVPQWYAYGDACTGSNGQDLELSISGTFASNQNVSFEISGALPMVPAQVLIGLTRNAAPLPLTTCTVWIDNIVAAFPPVLTDAAGNATTTWTVPVFNPPVAFTVQGVAVDTGVPSALKVILTNGVQVDIP